MSEIVVVKEEPKMDIPGGYGFMLHVETFFVIHGRKVYEVGPDDKWKERPDLDWRKLL